MDSAFATDFDDTAWSTVSLPHTWNAQDGQDGKDDYYRGDGWYRRTIPWRADYTQKQVYVEFLGANIQTEVYANGSFVGKHQGGYTAFRMDITPYVKQGEDTLLAVKVNNARSEEIAPLRADFTFFGGIYRDVSVIALDPVGHVDVLDNGSDGLYLTPSHVSDQQASLNIRADIVNDTAEQQPVSVTAELRNPAPGSISWIDDALPREWLPFAPDAMTPGGTVTSITRDLMVPAGGKAAFDQTITVDNPHLWKGKIDPYRYEVELVVRDSHGKELDRVSDFVGFRYDKVDADKGYFLNGQSYPLRGVNRHQDRQDMGWAIGQAQHAEDFAMIYEIGANTIRLAHYPHAPYFYELCDMYGIVVWAEIPFVDQIGGNGSYTNPDQTRANFFNTTRTQLVELIRQQYNRPSIVCWGLQNEIRFGSFEGVAQAFLNDLNTLAHQEDPTRFTTQALYNDTRSDTSTWPSDVVSWNLYPGWYYSKAESFGEDVDKRRAKDPTRPMGLSEYGYGSNIQHHQETVAKPAINTPDAIQSEEYQAYAHEQAWAAIRQRPWLWATHVWNMFDFAVDSRNEAGDPGKNNKGLVTYDRQTKKDVFYFYKANWSDQPVVHINSRRFANRTPDTIQVKGYSNCEQAELLVNGTSYGTLKQADLQQETVFVWSQVALRQGSNTVVMRGTRNGKTFEDTVVWMHVDADSTQITSSILSVDEAAHTIALMQPVAVSDISSVLTGAAGIRLRGLQADDSTVVNDGFVQPGMQLEVTSDNGSKTARYTFVWGNLSTGKPTTASSVYAKENSQASFATDGQSDTRWTADIHGSSAVYPEWLMVDLEQTYTLSRIETDWFTGTGTRCYTYRIEASVDGQHFEEIVDRTNNTTAGKVTDALSPIQGRYVRITVTGNSDLAAKPTAVASLFELRVYGWAVRSDTYVVDDAAHTITLSPGTGTIPAAQLWQHLVLEGQVTASVSDDTLTSGDTLVLTDAFGVSTTYALILPLQGDVDDNGQVDVIDALMVLQHSAQVIHLTNDQLSRADIDRDAAHQVTAADALMILQYATGNREVLE